MVSRSKVSLTSEYISLCFTDYLRLLACYVDIYQYSLYSLYVERDKWRMSAQGWLRVLHAHRIRLPLLCHCWQMICSMISVHYGFPRVFFRTIALWWILIRRTIPITESPLLRRAMRPYPILCKKLLKLLVRFGLQSLSVDGDKFRKSIFSLLGSPVDPDLLSGLSLRLKTLTELSQIWCNWVLTRPYCL